MGLTIHFKGQLRNINQLAQFVDEVEDIAKSLNWERHRIDRFILLDENSLLPEQRFEGGIWIRGIHITPPQCETLCLTFAPSGNMMSVLGATLADVYPEFDFAYWMHTKTQFAGTELHIALVSLLRYLEKKYFQSFEVMDEGEYWDSNDVDLLTKRFEEYTQLIAAVRGALEKETIAINLKDSDLMNRIISIIENGSKDLEN